MQLKFVKASIFASIWMKIEKNIHAFQIYMKLRYHRADHVHRSEYITFLTVLIKERLDCNPLRTFSLVLRFFIVENTKNLMHLIYIKLRNRVETIALFEHRDD